MSPLVSKPQPDLSKAENISHNKQQEEEDQESTETTVSSHVHLKPAHSIGTLDKEEVLRRIRQRKRANKVRSTLQGLVGMLFSSKTDDEKACVKWVDDAFAAP
ncbi:hypothetical protein Tsubulata_023576 [Turnera subulata]|uniref:Uncharacterized protein n=1 Tax=Turnera subulata TaxID=218843 RepID=A0A9Q0JHA1_9ROSI|nr:hypothetical protein Tsubulata_023576 [Turnera subulata]